MFGLKSYICYFIIVQEVPTHKKEFLMGISFIFTSKEFGYIFVRNSLIIKYKFDELENSNLIHF